MLYNIGCRNKCGNVHYSLNFIFFNPICEKKKEITLSQFFLYVLVPFINKIKKKSKYKLRTKFKVKVKVQRSTL